LKQLFRILIIALAGCYISYQTIPQLNHEDLFEHEGNIFYGVVAAIIFLIVLFFDTKQFRQTKKWKSFVATFIGISILIGHFMVLHSLKQIDNSPSQIYCVTKMNDFNGVSIDFRKDGTYKLTSWCLGADIYRGKYSIKDSIITLDKSTIENTIISDRLLMRQDGDIDSSSGIRERSIYQIDKQGQIINASTDFRVVDNWQTN
jgi:hypothetical protein